MVAQYKVTLDLHHKLRGQKSGKSLEVQWLGLGTLTAGVQVQCLVGELKILPTLLAAM